MRPSGIVLLVVILGAGVASAYHSVSNRHAPLAFSFNTGGALVLSGTIHIDVNGRQHLVTNAPCLRLLHPHARISPAELARLRHLAADVHFSTLPRRIRSSRMNTDMAGHPITVYTEKRAITVSEDPSAFNARFDRLYRALADPAPFSFGGPCRQVSS